jgi:hypothetical protein
MAEIATQWDIWNAGLIDGPEPLGRRTAAEIAAGRAEYARNFAEACDRFNQRWRELHGGHSEQAQRPYDSVRARLERLDRCGG